MITFLLPFKGIEQAKSRWSADAPQKKARLLQILQHNISTVASVVGASSTILVCPNWQKLPHFQDSTRWTSPGLGLNSDLEAARSSLSSDRKSGRLGVLLPDLPLLTVNDIESILSERNQAPVTLCPDRLHSGTNAILLDPSDAISFLFEGCSFQRYKLKAKSLGYKVRVVESIGLASDADSDSDLERDYQ